MSGFDPIERFLLDAERAARRGEREIALDLILLALDTAPGDPAVLVRAHAIRAMIPEDERTAPNNEPTIEPKIELPDPVELSTAARPSATTRPHIVFDLPDPKELRLVESGTEFIENEVDVPKRFAESTSTVAHKQISRPTPTRTRPKPMIWALWVLLGLAVLIAVGVVRNPQLAQRIVDVAQRYYDPVAAARHALEAGRFDRAERLLQEALAGQQKSTAAYILLGEVRLAQGDSGRAIATVLDGLPIMSHWSDLISAARLVMRAGDAAQAADIYLLAFEKGAPFETWREIAEAQQLAGRALQASHLLELLRRSEGGMSQILDTGSVTINGDTLVVDSLKEIPYSEPYDSSLFPVP